jgi:hypothetical protein
MISPFGRPLADENYIRLGAGRPGAAAHHYYLFGNGEVWCLEASLSMYCREWWVPVRGTDLDLVLDGGETVAQHVAAKRHCLTV